jgi:hypothetical protein
MKSPFATLAEVDPILRHLPTLGGQRDAYHTKSEVGWPVYTPEVRAFFKSVAPVAMRLDDFHDPTLRRMVADAQTVESADFDQVLDMLGVSFH